MRSPFAPILVLCLLLAASAGASPAMVAPEDATSLAKISFAGFAQQWMDKEQARAARAREAPRAQSGAAGVVFTYRAVGEDFETELHPTGRPGAPWVGVLHYTEHTYTCGDALGKDCRVTSSLPMTEVFRFRDGRWGY